MSSVRCRKGQAIVLVTLALFAMVGLMGLAVDMGWSFYVEKTSQAAADSAATAAVIEVLKIGGQGPYDPGGFRLNDFGGTVVIPPNSTSRYTCPSSPPNPQAGVNYLSREVACLYALRNGFGAGANTQTNVQITYGNQKTAPEVPDVTPVHYWTTAYVAQTVPQLFSAILGNTKGLVASKATAAIVDSELSGSLWLLNRENDCVPLRGNTCGVDLLVQANDNSNCPKDEVCDGTPPALQVAGGVIAASEKHGTSGNWNSDPAAMMAFGGATVSAEYFALNGQGGYYEGNNATFTPQPTNGFPSSTFEDPTEGMSNPPLPDPNQAQVRMFFTDGVIPGGADAASATPILPGIYAAAVQNGGQTVLTGNSIKLTGGYYKFVDASGTTQSGFSNYTFIGGLNVFGGSQVSVGPGQYVMMGAKPVSGEPGEVFSLSDAASMSDGLPTGAAAPSGNSGQIFVLAGPNYTSPNGFDANDYVARAVSAYGATNTTPTAAGLGLRHGKTRLQLGTNGRLNIHGLNPELSTALDQNGELEGHRRFVMWQDRDNSVVQYDDLGHIVLDPNCPSPCPDPLDYPMPNPDPAFDSRSTELRIQASPSGQFYGVVYQPRGAYTYMQGGGGYSGPLQLITGAFRLQGGTNLNMGILNDPLTQRVVALIQ